METTANEELSDSLIRHQTYLLRYSSYVNNRIVSLLNATEEDVAMRIRDRLAGNEGLRSTVQWKRFYSLVESVATIRQSAWSKASEFLINEMSELAQKEPLFLSNILNTVSPVVLEIVLPAPRLLKSIALSRPFEGRILKDWAKTLETEDIRRISNAIQIGMVSGEGNAAIARRVVGTSALNGTDGATQATRSQVQAITRTATQHIANNARNEMMQENADILEGEEYVATLDSRTTPVCKAYDGKIYPVGKGPLPPLHFSCRSLRVAYFGAERLGERPAKPVTEKQLLREYAEMHKLNPLKSRDDLPRGSKGDYDKFSRARIRQLTGQVPSKLNYQKWLEKQSNEFQDDTLGVTKAKLFRDGKLPLDRFIDKNGNELTLSDIAKRDASAFKAAGLNPEDFK